MKATRPKRARLETKERREQLLDAGRALFLSRPYDQVSMDDVAGAAGVSKALIFHYFKSKRDLYVELVRGAAEELLTATFVDESVEPLPRLMEGLARYLDYVEANAQGFVALLTSGVGVDPEVYAVVAHVRQTLADRLLAGVPPGLGGHSPASERHARLIVRGFIGFVEAASIDWLAHDKPMKKSELIERCVKVLLTALAPM